MRILTTLIVVVYVVCDTIFGSLVLLRFWGEFFMDYGEHMTMFHIIVAEVLTDEI